MARSDVSYNTINKRFAKYLPMGYQQSALVLAGRVKGCVAELKAKGYKYKILPFSYILSGKPFKKSIWVKAPFSDKRAYKILRKWD